MNPQAVLRRIRADAMGHSVGRMLQHAQSAGESVKIPLDPYRARVEYGPKIYKGKHPYAFWSSDMLAMDDADLPTRFDTHNIGPEDMKGRTLGEALERLREYTGHLPSQLIDVQLTPGGAHAYEIGSSMGRGPDFTPFAELGDPSYREFARRQGGYAARLSAKPERGENDFGAVHLMRIGKGQPLPAKEDLLTLHDSILRELYPASPARRDAIRTLAAEHERSLRPKDAALMRAIYGLGVAGAATLGEDNDT